MLRVIRSDFRPADVDEARAAMVEAAITTAAREGGVVRQTHLMDAEGHRVYWDAVIAYTDPEGQRRWAVVHHDVPARDIQDSDDPDEAVAQYEETVRTAIDDLRTTGPENTAPDITDLVTDVTVRDIPDEQNGTGTGEGTAGRSG